MKQIGYVVGLAVVAVLAFSTAFMFISKPVVQDGEQPQTFAAQPGPDVTEFATFLSGSQTYNIISTSTAATSQTLVATDIVKTNGAMYNEVFITPTVGDDTITLPASSTMKHFLPKAGMSQLQCINNASTTAGIDLTIAAGTGIDLEVASSTSGGAQTPVLTILADSAACFKWTRKPATAAAFDFRVQMLRYVDGD